MYIEKLPENPLAATLVKIKYDCCDKENTLTYYHANENFIKNNNKHICRICNLKINNPMKSKAVRDKVKATNLKRYGVSNPMNKPEHIEKRAARFKDPEYKEQWLEKQKQASLKHYGVEHPTQAKEVQDKQKATLQKKYGVDYPYQSEEIMKKMKENNLEKYGFENVASSPEVQIKMAKTTLERYGVEHYNELPEMKEYLAKNCKEWLKESYENPWAKGINRPEEWNNKQSETVSSLIRNGDWHGGFKSNTRGKFPAIKCSNQQNPRFLSSLELIYHYFLNTNPNVEKYEYESLTIPYVKSSDGTRHTYNPDFIVYYFNDPVPHIIETKTYQNKDSLDVQDKQKSALEYAKENKMTYTILFDEDISKLGISLDFVLAYPNLVLE